MLSYLFERRQALTRFAGLSKESLTGIATVVTFLIIGTLLVFHVQLFSGLRYMQPSDTDPRFINYVLERNHQWFLGQRPGEGFWDPPFCFPWQDLGTHTDSFIGFQPFFSPLRVAGLKTENAYQLCVMGMLVASFLGAWMLFRQGWRFGVLPAAVGAFVFAFSAPRAAQIGHVQLFAHFATPLAVLGLAQEFRVGYLSPRKWQWIWLFFAASAIQLYCSIYLTWFLAMFLGLAVIAALAWPDTRSVLGRSLRCKWSIWASGGAVSLLVSLPLLIPYFLASRRLPGSSFAQVFALLPQPESYLYMGYGSWIGSFLGINAWPPIATLQYLWEHAMCPGYLTTVVAIVGLWSRRRKPLVRVLVLVVSVAMLAVMRWPGGFTFWRWIFEVLPSANAIRAMTRISLPILLVVGYGVAIALASMARRWGVVPAALLAIFIVLEQGQTQIRYDPLEPAKRVRAIAQAIPNECQVFFYTGKINGQHLILNDQIDAMWAGLEKGIPTVNGYSGHQPVGWWEMVSGAMVEEPGPGPLATLVDGVAKSGEKVSPLCWVRVSFQGSSVTAQDVRVIPIP